MGGKFYVKDRDVTLQFVLMLYNNKFNAWGTFVSLRISADRIIDIAP